MNPIRKHTYKNATSLKLKNRRITVSAVRGDDTVYVQFMIACKKEDADIPFASHVNIRNKVAVTSLKLTREGAIALMIALNDELERIYDNKQGSTTD